MESKRIEHIQAPITWGNAARIYCACIEGHADTPAGRRAAVNAREDLIKMGEQLDKCMTKLKDAGLI